MNRYSFDELDHTHLLDGRPLYGTTTVLSVLAKPLTWWASGLAVKELSGIDDPSVFTRIKNKKATQKEIEDVRATVIKWLENNELTFLNRDVSAYLAMLDKAYRAHSVRLADTAQAGIDLHFELERFVKNEMNGVKDTYDTKIAPFVTWAIENVDKFLWSEGYCYSEKHMVGGISDVGAQLKDGRIGVMDFKSSKSAYSSYFFQDAGYDICISENGILDRNGNEVWRPTKMFDFYCVIPFGAPIVRPVFNDELNATCEGCRGAFLASLILYKQLQEMEQ